MKELLPSWLTELIAEQGDPKPMDVSERESLLDVLKAAYSPQPIAPEQHRRILEQVLAVEDPFAPPTEEELAAAASLREHLDSDPLVLTLRSAHGTSTATLDIEPTLRERALAPTAPPKRLRKIGRAPAFFSVMAVAAGVALWFTVRSSGSLETYEPAPPSLAVSRSTESLFSKPFDASSASERIDKIAQVRAKDLRKNRYAQWGLP